MRNKGRIIGVSNWLRKRYISLELFILLLFSQLLSKYIFWVFLCVFLTFIILDNGGYLTVNKIPGGIWLLAITILGCIVGFYQICFGSTRLWPYLRDIIGVSFIFLLWILLDNLCKLLKYDLRTIYTTIFLFVGIFSLCNFGIYLPEYIRSMNSFSEFTAIGGVNEFIIAIGVFISYFKPPCIAKYYINIWIDNTIKIVLTTILIISFSRTTYLVLVCLILPNIKKYLKPTIKVLLFCGIVFFITNKLMPDVTEFFLEKLEHSFTEISADTSRWTDIEVVQNWRGYEVYCALKEYEDFTTVQQFFGGGFGALVDVNNYAYLVTSESQIPFLHNGYYTMLIKDGIVGLCMNIFYYVSLLLHFIHKRSINKYERRVAVGLILSIMITTMFIHGPFFGGTSPMVICLLICFDGQNRKRQ